jgi:hypothetical protein
MKILVGAFYLPQFPSQNLPFHRDPLSVTASDCGTATLWRRPVKPTWLRPRWSAVGATWRMVQMSRTRHEEGGQVHLHVLSRCSCLVGTHRKAGQ